MADILLKIKRWPLGVKAGLGIVVIIVLIAILGAVGGKQPTTATAESAAATTTTVAVPASCTTTASQVAADPNADVAPAVKTCDALTVGQWRLLAAENPGLAGGDTDAAEVAAASCSNDPTIGSSTLCADAFAKCKPQTSDGVTQWACKTGE